MVRLTLSLWLILVIIILIAVIFTLFILGNLLPGTLKHRLKDNGVLVYLWGDEKRRADDITLPRTAWITCITGNMGEKSLLDKRWMWEDVIKGEERVSINEERHGRRVKLVGVVLQTELIALIINGYIYFLTTRNSELEWNTQLTISLKKQWNRALSRETRLFFCLCVFVLV